MYFFSKTTGGFFNDDRDLHGPRTLKVPDPGQKAPEEGEPDNRPLVEVENGDCKIPVDAIPITDELHAALMAGQAEGRSIVWDEATQLPVLGTIPPYYANFTAEQMKADFDSQRARAIQATQWLVDRHRDEQDQGGATTLSADRFKGMLQYRQAVRDMKMEYPLQFPANPEA